MKNQLFRTLKINIFLSFIFSFTALIGQDTTTSNSFIVESQVYPNWNSDSYKPALKLRLVLGENHVLRSNFLIDNSKTYREIFSSTGPNGGVGSVENIYQFFSLTLGYEHLNCYNRITVYNGLEGVFGVGRDDVYGSRTDSINFIADQNYSSKVPLQHVGLKIFSGINYNITPNLYVGTEVGLMLLKMQRKTGTYQVLDESSTTASDVTTRLASSSSTNLLFSGLGCVRVGWRFIKK
jgi:hypothetical protein